MTSFNWQLQTPIDTVVFDCDGTLSTLEGIDELAKKNNVGREVQELTTVAMGQTGINADLYEHRLNLVKPTEAQVLAQGQEYLEHIVLDVQSVISILKQLHKSIYVISAGLYPAVITFCKQLGIPRTNIFAVPIKFDSQGKYQDFDRTCPLVNRDGKRRVLQAIKQSHPAVTYVGDGMNDFAVYDMAERFVGYGGAFYYEKLASACQYYIKSKSMAALLPLALTETEANTLTGTARALYEAGLAAILAGEVNT